MNSTRWLMLVSAFTFLVSALNHFPFPTRNTTADVEILKPSFTMCRTGGSFALGPLMNYNEPIAPRLAGLGDLHFAVTTESNEAQAFLIKASA